MLTLNASLDSDITPTPTPKISGSMARKRSYEETLSPRGPREETSNPREQRETTPATPRQRQDSPSTPQRSPEISFYRAENQTTPRGQTAYESSQHQAFIESPTKAARHQLFHPSITEEDQEEEAEVERPGKEGVSDKSHTDVESAARAFFAVVTNSFKSTGKFENEELHKKQNLKMMVKLVATKPLIQQNY